jgi:cytochrome oxidase assembly protein ShyY1
VSGRYSFLKSGVWITGILIVVVTVVAFVNLGMWQLRRLDERRALNATIDSRMAEDPVDLGLLLATVGTDPEALEYRRVTATGTYNPEDEILLQARTLNGVSGHNVVTPLAMLDNALAVNRGWVPIDSRGPPVSDALPPAGIVDVAGILRVSEERGPTGVLKTTVRTGRSDGSTSSYWHLSGAPRSFRCTSSSRPRIRHRVNSRPHCRRRRSGRGRI